MKIGVIADTHIPDRADAIPEVILKEFRHVDMVIHAGDLVEAAVIEELKRVCKNVQAVWGNMDPAEVRELLPGKKILKIGKFRIGIMHGYGHPDKLPELLLEEFKNDNVNLVIFGHSHRPAEFVKKGIKFFNPGSVTDKLFTPFNSYGIIEINDAIESKIIKL
ncbi:MAG: metallophosphoesterase [Candidatus Omnitrophota bacterium]|nr:MAG: metallophosphoesterase [Candidatus Omnitrophota bacterium]